jgi:hypothetical protein
MSSQALPEKFPLHIRNRQMILLRRDSIPEGAHVQNLLLRSQLVKARRRDG